MNTSSRNNQAAAVALVAIAIAFFALAVFYFTQQTALLASANGIHTKHGIVAAGLGVLCLVGANIVRPKTTA